MIAKNNGRPTIFSGANVIDGTGAPGRRADVLVRSGKIVDVLPDCGVPDGANIIDVTGKTIIPGLIDMHGHLYARATAEMRSQFKAYPKLYLAGGVTSIRSPGDFDPEGTVALRNRINRGEETGARIFTAGPYFDHKPSEVKWITGIDGTKEASVKFEEWKGLIDLVKVYTRITEQEFVHIAKMAHAHGFQVVGHLGSLTARRAIELGIDQLEHGILTMTDFDSETLGELDMESPEVKSLIDLIAEREVIIDPTTVTFQMMAPDCKPVDPNWLRFLSPEARAHQMDTAAKTADQDPLKRESNRRAIEKQLEFVSMLRKQKVTVLCGTDPVHPGIVPGYGIHREMENLAMSGFTSLEIIKAATLDSARGLGVERDLGSIEAGKIADLAILDKDPCIDITNSSTIEMVIKEGIAYSPVKLRKSCEGQIS